MQNKVNLVTLTLCPTHEYKERSCSKEAHAAVKPHILFTVISVTQSAHAVFDAKRRTTTVRYDSAQVQATVWCESHH